MYAVAIDREKKGKWVLTAKIYYLESETIVAIEKLKRTRKHLMLSEANYKVFKLEETL